MGLTGAGLWTVLVQGRDALAPVVLLICGVVSLLIAVVGVIPQSFSAKDLSYTLRDERAIAEGVIDRLPASALLELATKSSESEAGASDAASAPVREAVTDAARRGLALRAAAIERVAKAWAELFPGQAEQFSAADREFGPFDVGVPIEPEGTLWLEVRLQRVTDAQVSGWQGQLARQTALLVICQEEPTLSAALLMRDPPIMYATLDASLASLTQTLERLVKHVRGESPPRPDSRRRGLDS